MLQNLSIGSTLNSQQQNISSQTFLKNSCLVLLGTLFLTFAAKIYIPLEPIPVTMQTFAVLFISMAYGWRLGTLTILAYIAEGALGLPVFSSPKIGTVVLLGATGGYIFGFVPAALISGYLAERGFGKHIITTAIAGLIGTSIISLSGVYYVSLFIGLKSAVTFGLKPFILVDLIKVALVSIMIPMLWRNRK